MTILCDVFPPNAILLSNVLTTSSKPHQHVTYLRKEQSMETIFRTFSMPENPELPILARCRKNNNVLLFLRNASANNHTQ